VGGKSNIAVLHVYRTYFPDPPGGLQEAIRQICLATRVMGFSNTVFSLSSAPRPSRIDRPEGCVIRSRSWIAPASCDLGGVDAFRKFASLAGQADVVHYHFPWPFADLLHLTVHPKVPAVMTYHSDIVRQRWLGAAYRPLMRRMFASMNAIVATSPAYAETSPVLSMPGVREKVHVIPLGIVEDSYDRQGDMSIFERLEIEKQEPYFLFIGVLRYYKGLHTLIQAAPSVNARIVIAGSGPEEASLRALRRQLGAANVVFAGQISDQEKVALLQRCRALALPSHLRSEAYGMVLVEAAMSGRPMISCEIGTGTSFVNTHEVSGFVAPPENPAALADAMNTLLSDEALARRMGQAARQRYEQLFSGPMLGKAYADLYREVM
jgi:rhamnosyl/mannosyltransferase